MLKSGSYTRLRWSRLEVAKQSDFELGCLAEAYPNQQNAGAAKVASEAAVGHHELPLRKHTAYLEQTCHPWREKL